jgi:hypothetical protein
MPSSALHLQQRAEAPPLLVCRVLWNPGSHSGLHGSLPQSPDSLVQYSGPGRLPSQHIGVVYMPCLASQWMFLFHPPSQQPMCGRMHRKLRQRAPHTKPMGCRPRLRMPTVASIAVCVRFTLCSGASDPRCQSNKDYECTQCSSNITSKLQLQMLDAQLGQLAIIVCKSSSKYVVLWPCMPVG